jgi:hypothetical protein
MCQVKIPRSYRAYFKKDILTSDNFDKLITLSDKLRKMKKYRFVPFKNLDFRTRKVVVQLIEKAGVNLMMVKRSHLLEAELITQVKEFTDEIEGFEEIERCEDIDDIKSFFKRNERELKKENNLPEDEDMEILSGYINFNGGGEKHLITQDEHFWRYKDLILEEFKITVVEEWNCDEIFKLIL